MNHIDLNSEEFQCDNYDQTLRLIKLTKLSPLDAKYLPLLESAFKGHLMAIGELANAFTTGNVKGIPVNYHWAKLFADTIHSVSLANASHYPEGLVTSYRNLGLTERLFGKLDASIDCFRNAIKFMAENLEPEKWDFSIHELMRETLHQMWLSEQAN